MADHRGHEEHAEVNAYDEPRGFAQARAHLIRQRQCADRQCPGKQFGREELPPREDEHERQQIQRKRHHPQQRHGGDIRGDVGRDPEQQAGRDRSARSPVKAANGSLAFRSSCSGSRNGVVRELQICNFQLAICNCPTARQHQQRHRDESHHPQPCLFPQRPVQLDEQRVAQQRREAADVARRVEKVRVARTRIARGGEPPLQKRRGQRQHEERRAYARQQPHEQPRGRPILPRGSGAFVELDGQRGQSREEEREMRPELRAWRKIPRHPMRRRVAREQHCLEEHHAGVPDRRRATELREDQLAHHWLHPEEQGGAPEQGDGEESGHAANARTLVLPTACGKGASRPDSSTSSPRCWRAWRFCARSAPWSRCRS